MGYVRPLVLVAVMAALLAGCGGAGKTEVPAVDDPDCTNNSASIGFKTPAGFTASMNLFTTSNCFAHSVYSTHAATTVLAGPAFTGSPGSPANPTLNVWLYLSYQFDRLQFLDGLPEINVHVPASIVVPGREFYIAYDANDASPPFTWTADPNYGPPQRVTPVDFLFVQWPSDTPSIQPNALYQFALYSLDGVTPAETARHVKRRSVPR